MAVCWCLGEIRDVPLLLYVSVLTPCLNSEKLCIAVDLMKGTFLVSLAQKGEIYTRIVHITCSQLVLVLYPETVLCECHQK